MMKYFFLLLTLLSMENMNLRAQKGEIEGSVVDKESSESIPFASIAVLDINSGAPLKGTVSDNSGKFIIEDLDGQH
jgi:iron complex outermembrane receptor protein